MRTAEILQPFRPVMGARAWDGGGREVVGWVYCSWWQAALGWVELLVERNVKGCLPFETNPEPWPGFWWGVQAAEISHSHSPWFWTARTSFGNYPLATAEQIKDVLTELGIYP